MRLICPNCDAEYEVDAAAIPVGGRDVQCSNCGHAWYQYPQGLEPEEDIEVRAVVRATRVAAEALEERPSEFDPTRREPAGVPPVTATDAGEDDTATPLPRRRALDESLLAVLREEAEREAQARRAEAGSRGLEVQPELGLPSAAWQVPGDAAPLAPTARSGPAAVPADKDETSVDPSPVPHVQARRDLLPDIEEINSTLRSNGTTPAGAGGSEDEEPVARRRGFRTGFLMVMLVVIVGTVIYAYAPRISAAYPSTAPALKTYVDLVERGRTALDEMVVRLIRMIDDAGASRP